MRPGEEILVSCGDDWEYTCRVLSLERGKCWRRFWMPRNRGKELPSRLYLFQCLPKGDKMEWIIQKAVELGAYRVVPVASRRCIVRLEGKKGGSPENPLERGGCQRRQAVPKG